MTTNDDEKIPTHGIVYMCENAEHGVRYIGSTIQSLYRRMHTHKSDYIKWCSGSHSNISIYSFFQQHGFDAFEWKALEMIDNIDGLAYSDFKKLLHEVEGQYIREMDCVNKIVAGRTNQQYYEDHKDYYIKYREEHAIQIRTYKHLWYINNREKILKKHRERVKCPDCGSEMNRYSLRRHMKRKHQ